MTELYTIGHSNHAIERFLELLRQHAITAVGDVRSSPYSKFNPQYNRENLQKALKENGIAYVYLGRELGPRSDDPACCVNGQVQYSRLAKTELFRHGVGRLLATYSNDFLQLIGRRGIEQRLAKELFHRGCLLCSEASPDHCHRRLVAEYLAEKWGNVDIVHLL